VRARRRRHIPATFWVFAAFAVLYGFCETMNGNWSQIDLIKLHVSATTASLTRTVFWAMVTAGRVVFAAVQRWVPSRVAYHCSALLPLTISFGQERLVSMSSSVASGVIACYQVGYGIAAFGIGPLRSAGLTLADIYGASAEVAVVLGLLSVGVAKGRPSPASLHPRPASHLT
jgi:hypothetical protein